MKNSLSAPPSIIQKQVKRVGSIIKEILARLPSISGINLSYLKFGLIMSTIAGFTISFVMSNPEKMIEPSSNLLQSQIQNFRFWLRNKITQHAPSFIINSGKYFANMFTSFSVGGLVMTQLTESHHNAKRQIELTNIQQKENNLNTTILNLTESIEELKETIITLEDELRSSKNGSSQNAAELELVISVLNELKDDKKKLEDDLANARQKLNAKNQSRPVNPNNNRAAPPVVAPAIPPTPSAPTQTTTPTPTTTSTSTSAPAAPMLTFIRKIGPQIQDFMPDKFKDPNSNPIESYIYAFNTWEKGSTPREELVKKWFNYALRNYNFFDSKPKDLDRKPYGIHADQAVEIYLNNETIILEASLPGMDTKPYSINPNTKSTTMVSSSNTVIPFTKQNAAPKLSFQRKMGPQIQDFMPDKFKNSNSDPIESYICALNAWEKGNTPREELVIKWFNCALRNYNFFDSKPKDLERQPYGIHADQAAEIYLNGETVILEASYPGMDTTPYSITPHSDENQIILSI